LVHRDVKPANVLLDEDRHPGLAVSTIGYDARPAFGALARRLAARRPEAVYIAGLDELAAALPAPTVFVRRGTRPGGLAPPETRTRFSWSLTGATG
jgi:serine/threonine protein kinase